MQYTKRLRSHGIDAKDFKIIQRIFERPKGSSEISGEVNIPRPTVLFRLNKLADRGLVVKSGIRPVVNWSPSKTCLNILSGKDGALLENKTTGISNIESRLKRLFEEAQNKRIFYLFNVKHMLNAEKKFSEDFKKAENFLVINGKVIQDGVTSISGNIFYRNMDISRRRQNARKMVCWVVVDDEYIDEEDSFYIFEDRVFVINLEKEFIKEIESGTLSDMVINHIKNISRLGRKVDISKLV